ncbi:MAG: hypothetical protein CFH19_01075 [Alphaproteobacteria bacterium MarineAlpha5_Bin9]|nr:MAG: hypothetical protein CFH19_01075 [Alphaproteobacteria bacterium MarineAlpha5_Bin9]|tara:strand:- start:16743 stop:17864 length:1122 start_codon:yes stop_codon:yes gene_type:complete
MTTIHWLGAGLSSIPGIRRIASKKNKLTVWNRTLSKAQQSINHISYENLKAKKFDYEKIKQEIKANDIIVSQLPANMHLEIAKICLDKNCHFISSSYLSDEIKELNKEVNEKKLIFLNEVGLDPGIDHFFSHLLVKELKSLKFKDISVSYRSYCGGIPSIPNDLKYKFSWSPVGVIKALNNISKFIENYEERSVVPFKNINSYMIKNEIFEAYPNRNSLPYINEYNFDKKWRIKDFVRGTLRLKGWGNAWKNIFQMLENSSNNLEELITKKSDELIINNKYKEDDEDRVVLSVELDAIKDNKKVWSKSFHLDEKGSGENTAMAKLVSLTLSAGIDLIIENNLQTGVQGAPSNKIAIEYFFKVLSDHLIKINYK